MTLFTIVPYVEPSNAPVMLPNKETIRSLYGVFRASPVKPYK